MSKHAFLLLLSAVLTSGPTFADENDLFSDVRPVDVFAESATRDSAGVEERLTSATQIRDLLNAAGFDAKTAGDRAVVLKKSLAPWSFPVLVNLAEDEQHVAVLLGLRTIKDSSELTAEVLLKMMAASRKRAPVVFTYSENRTRTEACVVLRNTNLNGQLLRDEINRLAIAARDEAELWSAAQATPETADKDAATLQPSAAAPKTPPQTTDKSQPDSASSSEQPTASLLGRWSASKSTTEAFAIEFKADSTFRLVYVKSGRQTLSNGRYTIADDQLTLDATDGLKLIGKLTIASDQEFRFTPGSGSELVFRKAAK